MFPFQIGCTIIRKPVNVGWNNTQSHSNMHCSHFPKNWREKTHIDDYLFLVSYFTILANLYLEIHICILNAPLHSSLTLYRNHVTVLLASSVLLEHTLLERQGIKVSSYLLLSNRTAVKCKGFKMLLSALLLAEQVLILIHDSSSYTF